MLLWNLALHPVLCRVIGAGYDEMSRRCEAGADMPLTSSAFQCAPRKVPHKSKVVHSRGP